MKCPALNGSSSRCSSEKNSCDNDYDKFLCNISTFHQYPNPRNDYFLLKLHFSFLYLESPLSQLFIHPSTSWKLHHSNGNTVGIQMPIYVYYKQIPIFLMKYPTVMLANACFFSSNFEPKFFFRSQNS